MAIRKFSSSLFFGCLILLIMGVSFSAVEINQNNPDVIASFVLNGIVWFILIISSINKTSYSFQLMHWMFNFYFLFFSALIQYLNNDFVYNKYIQFSDSLICKTNFLLLLWTFSVLVGGHIAKRVRFTVSKSNHNERIKNSFSKFEFDYRKMKSMLIVLSVVSVLITVYRIRVVGIVGLFSHATSTIIYGDSGITSLISSLMRALLYFACAFSIIYYKKYRNIMFVLVNGICILISYFPTGTSRFIAAAIYLGLLLTFSENIKKNNLFPILLTIGLLIIWPFLNSYRRVAFMNVDIYQNLAYTFKNIPYFWSDGDFDAYSIVMCTQQYVEQSGATLMMQLIGVLLFFIPRPLWPGKPIGSGAVIASYFHFSSTNVSAPLAAEAYINLGIFGVLLFGVVIGYIVNKIDSAYWGIRSLLSNSDNPLNIIYPVTLILFFFVSRGDLLSSFSHVISFVFVWLILTKIVSIKA